MRRKLIIYLSAFVVIIGVSVAVILSVNRSPKLQNVVNSLANKQPTNSTTTNTNSAVTNTAIVTPDRSQITFVARNFAERFGSASSENNGSNLVAAQAYGTQNFNEYLDEQIILAKVTRPTTYTGTIARALVFDFLRLNAANASVVVSTQYESTVGTTTTTKNRDLLIDLVKVGGDWRVNAAAWK